MTAGHWARGGAVLVGGATLTACCALAALNERAPGAEPAGLPIPGGRDLIDPSGWLPRGLATVGAGVAGVLLLALLVPLLVVALRALWLLLRRLFARLGPRRPVTGGRRRLGPGGDLEPGPEPPVDEQAAPEDLLAVRRALAGSAAQAALRLRQADGGDTADEIVRCWESIERTAVEKGRPRLPSDTPTEFTRAVLDGFQVDAGQLGVLLDVYGRARFSRRRVDHGDLHRARAAFERLHRDLSAAHPVRG